VHRAPQHERGVGVFVAQLQPLFAPVVERPQDAGQVAAGVGELVGDAAAPGLGAGLDHADALKEAQPLGEETVRKPGRSGADLAERGAACHQVADDDRRPSLGEDLRGPGNRAVLTVGPHAPSVAPHRPRVLLFLS
jgi:hypothetical protein